MVWNEIRELLFVTTVSLAILVPVVGLTVRFTVGPIIEKFIRLKAGRLEGLPQEIGELRGEVASLRMELSELKTDLRRLADGREFDRELGAAAELDRS